MFRYLFAFFAVFLICFNSYAQKSKFGFSVSDDTPASFFGSGIATYFFKDDIVGVLKFSNEKLFYGMEKTSDISSISDISSKSKGDVVKNDLILSSDGTALLVRDAGNDHSCWWNSLYNCLYSDITITEIDVKNLMGNTDVSKIGYHLNGRNKIKFPIGSKIYSFKTKVSQYNFETFNDFANLVCSKNEEGMCRAAISGGVIDKAALFELVHGKGALSDVMFYDTGKKDVAYVYDIEGKKVSPYSASCLEKSDSKKALRSCSLEDKLPIGNISEHRHKASGIVYWIVDYKNPDIDNAIFFLNSRGEPFKIYINPINKKVFNMYNETAAKTIFGVM